MAWSKSAIFRAWLECALGPRPGFTSGWNKPPGGGGYDPDPSLGTFLCSLWRDGITPDETAPAITTGYGSAGGQWVTNTGQEVTAGSGWPAGGVILTGTGTAGGFNSAGGTITFGGANAVSPIPVTMSGIYGDMVFHYQADGTISRFQGLCFHYYGGPCEVDAGTFTVVWPPERIAQIQFGGP